MPTSNILGTGVVSRARFDAAKMYESVVKSSPGGPLRPRSADELAKVPSGSAAVGQEKDGKRVRRVLASREDRLEGQIGGDNHTT